MHLEIFGEKMPTKTQDIVRLLEKFLRFAFSNGISRLMFESNIEVKVLRDSELQERLYFDVDTLKSAHIDAEAITNSFVNGGDSLQECLIFMPMNLIVQLSQTQS